MGYKEEHRKQLRNYTIHDFGFLPLSHFTFICHVRESYRLQIAILRQQKLWHHRPTKNWSKVNTVTQFIQSEDFMIEEAAFSYFKHVTVTNIVAQFIHKTKSCSCKLSTGKSP